ncbi:hypothetical protein SAMN05216499_105138 [Actinacidiphila paucisporea]|uniref:Uncharacterized protein n=1 Tax=Actinacidiphila paucisporea TaxID=310782 RepID=A0A1M7C4I4_9ACTN|nr:hypothetical protein SAMN05216499_105138 [Actinacidiphila paucisporea]
MALTRNRILSLATPSAAAVPVPPGVRGFAPVACSGHGSAAPSRAHRSPRFVRGTSAHRSVLLPTA